MASSTTCKKRVLTAQQLEVNRVRSKQYYEDNREEVLAKLRQYYNENREQERLRQRLKYQRIKARKLELKKQTLPASPSATTCREPHPSSNPLSISFLLN
ncbi:hypothetical protein ACHHYP_10110 [Achlya hypogyna]|uniref:Uncharacterized protein n=1 Tax=Achlya hypogyna TaxID=1202772 RepID=A0A1V9ZI81_ACHHY|nr:hypothetical protein ACHHYP_10110 [Achlya hypogyna]